MKTWKNAGKLGEIQERETWRIVRKNLIEKKKSRTIFFMMPG